MAHAEGGVYNLAEQTALLGEKVIKFIKTLSNNDTNKILANQLLRSATSIGANYMEADTAESRKDFEHKIGICKKESKETLHWLRMVSTANEDKTQECRLLWKEAHELVLIFSSIIKSTRKN